MADFDGDESVKMPFDYPYTVAGKLRYFPYKFHWQKGRFIRYLAAANVVLFGVAYWFTKQVNSPGNVKMWSDRRKAAMHNFFEFNPEHEKAHHKH